MSEIADLIKAYRRWRKRHTFATPDIELKAMLVERDIDNLPRLQPHCVDSLALIQAGLSELEEILQRHPPLPKRPTARNSNSAVSDALLAAGAAVSAA